MPRGAFGVVLVWLVLLLLGGTAHAEAILSITPAELALSPGVPERVVVTLSGTAAELQGADLKILPPPGLAISGREPTPTSSGTRGWIVTLRSDASLIASSAAVLVRTTPKLFSGTLKVSPATPPAATAQFTADLIYNGESLFDKAEGNLQLRLTNLSDSTLSLVSRLSLPGFLKQVCRQGKACPPAAAVTLAPRETTVIGYRIAVDASEQNPLTTGKHQLSATVSATRLEGARPWQASQIVTRELTVGIPGLEGIQTLIQIPSFLLLPGFLICVVALMTWRWWRPPAAEAGEPDSWTMVAMSPPLWVLAISISMMVVWLYPSISALLGAGRRNLLQGFDLSDVIRVWVGSIITGFVLASLGAGILRLWKFMQGLRTFGTGDKPEVALRKMKRQGLETVTFQMRNEVDTGRLFRIGEPLDDGRLWAFPAIRYASKKGFDEVRFVAAIGAKRIAEIVAMVDRGVEQGTLSVRWDKVPNGGGPRIVDAAIFTNPDQTGLLLDAE